MADGAKGRSFGRAVVPLSFGLMAVCGCIGVCCGSPCLTTGVRYGLWADECPDSDLRLTTQVNGWGLLRGRDGGMVEIAPVAHWLVGEGRNAWENSGFLSRGYDWELELVDDAGKPVEGLVLGKKRRGGSGTTVGVTLPQVPDGDYALAVRVTTPFETVTNQVPLPLYAPALVHTMTDRPLYKPGQTVLFRSATLRRTDEHPLDGRPGRWVVRSPSGDEMLVEKDRAGAWGIADGSFPLDADAEQGTWTVTWQTGEASDTVSFDVRPFRLPRFTVEARPASAWFAIGEPLVVEGRAAYSSGAPVAGAPVDVSLRLGGGRWPMPIEWEEPKQVRTGVDGRFTVDFGRVPPDLMDTATLSAVAEVTEQAGERAAGATNLVLSHESLKIEAVTELGDGLVEGFNNRAYVRATTPDGQPLANAKLVLKRPYDPLDEGKVTTTDVDGVAAIQLDPGPPVTVVLPAAPARPRPFVPPPPSLADARELSENRGLDFEERRVIDGLLPAIADCGTFAVGDGRVELGVRADASGAVRSVLSMYDDPLAECVTDVVRRARFPASEERTWRLTFDVPDSRVPSLSLQVWDGRPDATLQQALTERATVARRCFARGEGANGSQLWSVHWTVTEGQTRPELTFEREDTGGLSPATLSCVNGELARTTLSEPASSDAMGVTAVMLSVPSAPGEVAPQPIATTAYELRVVAGEAPEELGTGRLILPVGQVPPMRLRATPSLTTPDTDVKIELVRGPNWSGALPEELWLYQGTAALVKSKVVEKAVTFHIPPDVEGFVHTEFAGARAVVFVAPAQPLSVRLSTDAAVYEPGSVAKLTVTTKHGDAPVPAGVSLVGVDQLLGQLVPLVGPDDFGRVTVRATSDRPPFGTFDARALALGQIRGENAARAAVLRIGQLPMDPAGDQALSVNTATAVATEDLLVRNFYRALLKTIAALEAWEKAAGPETQLSNEAMVELWDRALDELGDEGDPAVDAWGRPLTLAVLPDEMLAQVDPRKLISDATHLPEDVEDFVQFVHREVKP